MLDAVLAIMLAVTSAVMLLLMLAKDASGEFASMCHARVGLWLS